MKPTAGGYNPKIKATYIVRQGKVTGSIDQLVKPPKYPNGITCDPMLHNGTFTGRIEGNVITGTWETEILPHKQRIPSPPGSSEPPYDCTESSPIKSEIQLTLNADGTVSQTEKGRGEGRSTWGANRSPRPCR